jgi:type IV secretion system protein TrbL
VLRSGLLIVMTGALPVAASFTAVEAGRQAFARYCGWVIALVAYKPAAAFVYAAAFQLAGSGVIGGKGAVLIQPITGLALMLVALLALPALLRLAAPVAMAVRAGGTPRMPGAASERDADIATGAVRLATAYRRQSMPFTGEPVTESRQQAPTGSIAAAGRVENNMTDDSR